MTRLTDYGIMLLSQMARELEHPTRTARELSAEAHLPLPTVSKVLKLLAKNGLLETHRGVKGGFRLTRKAEEVTVADIIDALEGPIGLTECSAHSGQCGLEPLCPVRSNWRKINRVVMEALKRITLAEMIHPLSFGIPVEMRKGSLVQR